MDEAMIAYSPDQARTDEGKFEDEGMGHSPGDKNAPGTTREETAGTKTKVTVKGTVSDVVRQRVEKSLARLPEKTSAQIKEVHIYEEQGPMSEYDHGEFRVGGRAFTNNENGETTMMLFKSDRFAGEGAEKLVDDFIGHEAGHSAWGQPEGTYDIRPQEYSSFYKAAKNEGCLTAYAQAHYDQNESRGNIENFAEWYSMYHQNDEGDLAYMRDTKPRSYKAFDNLWTKMGGGSKL